MFNNPHSKDLFKKRGAKLFLCFNKHHDVKTYDEVEVYFHAFLTSALDRSEWSVSHLDYLPLALG
jgi:hypothetical protein